MLDLLALYLQPYNYDCIKIKKAEEALYYLKKDNFDIVLLDIMMPNIDGWELCKRIREFSNVPIIMITARDQQDDIVKGLRLGADDYITKPFDGRELLARIKALIRRMVPKKTIEINGLCWNEDKFELTYNDQIIKLTPKEFLVIGQLMKQPTIVYTREQLIELIWGFNSETEGRTIDSHIRNMREKVRQAGFPIDDYLVTVWGIGYKWVIPHE
jgi:DNA-binding response OmpR family regulator